MKLERDEVIGLVIAAVVGAAALATYAYRGTKGASPGGAAEAVEEPQVVQVVQDDRDRFADVLHQAFSDDGVDAAVIAERTSLHVRWFSCSKKMLATLLDTKDDTLTRKVRQASGLSLEKLRRLGFTELVCDNTRGKVFDQLVGPAAKKKR